MKARITGMALALCMMLSGCSGASEDVMKETMAANGIYMDSAADMDIADGGLYVEKTAASMTGTAQNSSADPAENDLENRKLIRNANLNVETKTYDQFAAALEQQIAACGGYVQTGETSGSADRGNRWASYTIRVPEVRYTAFLTSVSELGTVTYRSENVQDVTMEYTDVEARIRALETEHETLLSILEKCEVLDDVITVQSRITEVQYELDSYKSRIRRYDDLIAYCTVYLSVSEVEKVTVPVEEQTLGERIAEDLRENCEDITEDAENFAVWFVSSLPYFGIWIAVIGGVLLLALQLGKRSRRKLGERMQTRQKQEAEHPDDSAE